MAFAKGWREGRGKRKERRERGREGGKWEGGREGLKREYINFGEKKIVE